MKINKSISSDTEIITISAEDKMNIVRINGGVLICKSYTLVGEDKLSDFIEVPDGNDYRVKRSNAYPSIGDQLDMIWHCIDEGKPLDKTSEFYLALKEVKDKYKKED